MHKINLYLFMFTLFLSPLYAGMTKEPAPTTLKSALRQQNNIKHLMQRSVRLFSTAQSDQPEYYWHSALEDWKRSIRRMIPEKSITLEDLETCCTLGRLQAFLREAPTLQTLLEQLFLSKQLEYAQATQKASMIVSVFERHIKEEIRKKVRDGIQYCIEMETLYPSGVCFWYEGQFQDGVEVLPHDFHID